MHALLVAVLAALTAAPPHAPARWVEDNAGFLTPATRDALDARLEAYQHATGHQVVVWIGKTLAGEPLDEWAVRTFEAWQVGRKGFDDGIAMFVLADDRLIDIEVGYGLEDKVPDAIASRIIRETMTPRLRAGDRDGAITAGVDALLAAIDGKPSQGAATTTEKPPPSWIEWAIYGALGLLVLVLAIRYPRAAMWLFWALLAAGRHGGGGRGGFRGGGGRSGGGGARGGW